tara:strand:+ start:4972 stop:6042 length:1071 start_codon:yes stop_codon:yes gene_type:complete
MRNIILTNLKPNLINIGLIVISISFSLFFLEVFLRYYYDTLKQYPTNHDLIIYDRLAPSNHHIRSFDKKLFEEGKQYYSTYMQDDNNTIKKDDKIFIIQGDSWVEFLDKTRLSKKMLTIYDVVINGGTTSYAPSLMEIQLNDIIGDLDIKPTTIVAFIDQTDFIDEACDYSKFRVTSDDGNLLMVSKPSGYFHERYKRSDYYETYNAVKYKTLFLIWSFLEKQFNSDIATNSQSLCKWEDIVKFMHGSENANDHVAFRNSVVSYLNKALSMADNVIVLTHKHRGHFEDRYENDIYQVLESILYDENLHHHVKLIDLSLDIEDIDLVFPIDKVDPASHPHWEYYNGILDEKIYAIFK